MAIHAEWCAEEPACCAEGSTGGPRPLCTGSSGGPPGGSSHPQRLWLRLKLRLKMKSVMVARCSLSRRMCSRDGGAAGCCRWMLSLPCASVLRQAPVKACSCALLKFLTVVSEEAAPGLQHLGWCGTVLLQGCPSVQTGTPCCTCVASLLLRHGRAARWVRSLPARFPGQGTMAYAGLWD